MAEDREEVLLAYLDGELEGADLARAERLIAEDPEARAFVEKHRRIGDKLRQAFEDPMEEEVPERLLRPFEDQQEATAEATVVPFRSKPRQAAPRRWTELAMAASVALCVGGVIGLNLDFGPGEDGAFPQAVHMAGPIDRGSPLHQVLEEVESFESVTWEGGNTAQASAIALLSFRTTDGRICREYEMLVTSSNTASSTIGIACRGADAGWTDEVLVVSKQALEGAAEPAYEAASSGGQVALEGFIAETIVGEPLSPEEERALIGNSWR